jgi:2-polyprenyl-6-methoxyphenol hydroxylase-like FAD-dependent oxidoreductase
LLIESLPEETIRWGHKVTSVRAVGKGRHEVAFSNGSTCIADLVVGADGAWSKVRAFLTDIKPVYTGTCFVETHLSGKDPKRGGDWVRHTHGGCSWQRHSGASQCGR